MNIDLNWFDDAKLSTLFYTTKCFSDYFQKSLVNRKSIYIYDYIIIINLPQEKIVVTLNIFRTYSDKKDKAVIMSFGG